MSNNTFPTGVNVADKVLRDILQLFQRAFTNICTSSAGLTIGSSSKAKPKIANTVQALIDGVVVVKTTAEITLTTANNVANGKFAAILLTLAANGTVTPTNSPDVASLALVRLPNVPAGEVAIGYVIINPTGTGGFVGGTTELDDGTVVPNAQYFNIVGPYLPQLLDMDANIA